VAIRPISRPALLTELADRVAAAAGADGGPPDRRVRVGLDGAPPTEPDAWADDLVDPLRVRGLAVLHVPAAGFLRPASERFELGRTDPDAYYERWRNDDALRREVLDPAGPDGSGRVLPSLWDTVTDRATRASYVQLPAAAAVIVSGGLLLGAGLPFDLEVHLEMSAEALRRRTRADEQWTTAAYVRYAAEVDPARFAAVVVRLNDPRRPALVEPDPRQPDHET
jgi:hypothetical protein